MIAPLRSTSPSIRVGLKEANPTAPLPSAQASERRLAPPRPWSACSGDRVAVRDPRAALGPIGQNQRRAGSSSQHRATRAGTVVESAEHLDTSARGRLIATREGQASLWSQLMLATYLAIPQQRAFRREYGWPAAGARTTRARQGSAGPNVRRCKEVAGAFAAASSAKHAPVRRAAGPQSRAEASAGPVRRGAARPSGARLRRVLAEGVSGSAGQRLMITGLRYRGRKRQDCAAGDRQFASVRDHVLEHVHQLGSDRLP